MRVGLHSGFIKVKVFVKEVCGHKQGTTHRPFYLFYLFIICMRAVAAGATLDIKIILTFASKKYLNLNDIIPPLLSFLGKFPLENSFLWHRLPHDTFHRLVFCLSFHRLVFCLSFHRLVSCLSFHRLVSTAVRPRREFIHKLSSIQRNMSESVSWVARSTTRTAPRPHTPCMGLCMASTKRGLKIWDIAGGDVS